MAASDRGAQIRQRAKDPLSRHMCDIRGATGCYYCWLGEYDKCRENCQLVHAQPHDPMAGPAGRLNASSVQRSRSVWETAAPQCSQAARQFRSMYNEGPTDLPGVAATHGFDPDGRSADMNRSDSRILHRSGSPSASSRRRNPVYSLHEPSQFIPKYKHPRAAELIHPTKYTAISITPSSHCYMAHHSKFVAKDSAIWSGSLVKHGRTAPVSAAADGVEADAHARSTSGVLRESVSRYPDEQRNAAMRSGRVPPSTPTAVARREARHTDGRAQTPVGQRAYPRVTEEEQLGAILSGRYQNAFALPLPATFAE